MGYALSHWKALSHGKYEQRGLSCGSTLNIFQDILRISNLLHKQGFVDSQMKTTVIANFHVNLDDGFIHVYLRGCKYNLEDTKQRIDTWHTVRTRHPEMFENWNYKDPKIKELISAG